jgi:hypothetical protein
MSYDTDIEVAELLATTLALVSEAVTAQGIKPSQDVALFRFTDDDEIAAEIRRLPDDPQAVLAGIAALCEGVLSMYRKYQQVRGDEA